MNDDASARGHRPVSALAPYRALLSARFRTMLQYRAAAVAGAGTQFFWGFIRIMILMAFYRSSSASPPMDLEDVISYIWLGQAFLALLPWTHDRDLEGLIRDGGVAYELLRPRDGDDGELERAAKFSWKADFYAIIDLAKREPTLSAVKPSMPLICVRNRAR